jgi:hypothetical protein
MKKINCIIWLLFIALSINAQNKLSDINRIVLNTYVPIQAEPIPDQAKSLLENKLSQIASSNGMGGSAINPRFIITANINLGTKDILAGPPQMIAQNIEVSFFIGDAVTNTIFSNATLSLKGVGTNENKAFIEAFKTINPKNKVLVEFLNEGKSKIINYYSTNCDFLLKDAQTLAIQEKYDEAIYNLSLVPQVCEVCFNKTAELIATIYQQKIDADCKTKLSQARIAWAGQQNISNAENALNILIGINPNASCYHEVMLLTKEINNKLLADEKAQFELALKKYNDKINLEKKRIEVYKEIAIEYAKSQPKVFTYNTIIWR